MIDYLYIFAASDSHIEFICENPSALWNFMEGSKCCLPAPQPAKSFLQKIFEEEETVATLIETPEEWPKEHAEVLGPEISNLTIELYHRILCGGDKFVFGGGALFQTWLVRENGAAIDIDGKGDNFAFTSDKIPELKHLASLVDESRVMYQYCLWLRKEGRQRVPSDEEISKLMKEFKDFATQLQKVEEEGKGLIWIRT